MLPWLLCAPLPGRADMLLGAGFSRFQISSDHPAIPDVSPAGYQVQFMQVSSSERHALLLTVGGSEAFGVDPVDTPEDPFYPADHAEYGFFDLAYQYRFAHLPPATRPYLSIGWGFSSVNWKTFVFDQSGFGTTLGAGLMFDLDEHWAVDLGIADRRYNATHVFFTTGDESAETTRVTRLSVTLLYRFSP